MSPALAHFLQRLSHEWSALVLLCVVALGVASFFTGRARAKARASGDIVRTRRASGLRIAVSALFACSLMTMVVSFLHIGCAAAMSFESHCHSNEKDIALAVLSYAQDYDERLPPSASWSECTKTYRGMPVETYRCPEAETAASYGANAQTDRVPLDKVDQPADFVLLFEADTSNLAFAGGARDVARRRHVGTSNFAFGDGHVKRVPDSMVDALGWSQKASPVKR